jgi:hypothetical protein
MFEIMGVQPERVLSGYFVPFRSRDWDSLPKKPEAVQCGIELWTGLFSKARKVTTVLAFGKEIAADLSGILGVTKVREEQAGWGKLTIDIYAGAAGRKLIVLPHLSRFGLFDRLNADASIKSFRSSLV